MSIRFVIGRAGSGKSECCLIEMKQQLAVEPEGDPLVLLVPEQATFQAEHAIVSDPGIRGMIRAQVLSFHRLAWRVMQEEGGTARLPIDDMGKKLLLTSILHKQKEKLRLFGHSAEQMGFVDRLNQLFTEMKRYCVTAKQLEEHEQKRASVLGESGLLRDKMHDIQLIYRQFESELSRQYLDGEDYLTLLAEQIPNSAYLRSASIWIDGFHGFTPQEFAVLGALFSTCKQVTITLCLDRELQAGDAPDELDLFHPTATTMVRLQELIWQLGLPSAEVHLLAPDRSPRYDDSPLLGYLERNFDRRIGGGAQRYKPAAHEKTSDQLVIAEAVHRRAEVEGAVRDMLQLVREHGVRWREIAVMVRNMEGYQDLLKAVLTDYEIPHFFDQKRTVLHHPLVEFIRSALEVVQHNWHYDAVFRCVKTDLLLPSEAADQRTELDKLENYVLAFGIQGYRWTDGKPWSYKFRANLEEADEGVQEQTAELAALNRSKEWVVRPLLAFAKRLQQAGSVKAQVEALYELLIAVQAPEKLEAWSQQAIQEGKPEKAREHGQMWNSVMEMLDQLVETMGDDELSLEIFNSLVETGMESMKLGLVPPSMDQLLIGSMDRTRSSGIRYAYILGVNDGVIPAQMPEKGVLTEAERSVLMESGLPMADGSRRKLLDEQFIVYTSLTVPGKRLWMSYPLADEEGKSLLPSELIKQMRQLFPGTETPLLLAEPAAESPDNEQAAYMAHPNQAISYLAVRMKHWMLGGRMADLWWETYNWYADKPEWQMKLQSVVQALRYTNKENKISSKTSKLLYGQNLRASVSRMEKYVACPFSHFVSHGLRLQERRVYRLDAPDIGQLFHAALNQFVQRLQQDQLDWGSLSAEECMERSAQVVDELAPRLQGEILLSSSRYAYIARKLKQVVGRAAVVLGEHAKQGQFEPLGLEIDFGPGKELPPLTFDLENGCTMEIIGRIDRVDRADGEQGVLLRVIDYKSSSTSLQLSEVYYGLSLQMLTYLDVIITHAERWLGIAAKPAGVLYFHVHNPMLQQKNALDPAAVEKELRKRFKMKGLITADAEVAGLMDRELLKSAGHSQLIPVALKKDGSFYSSSSVATDEQWDTLRKYVRKQVKGIGTSITDGHVDIAPYRLGKKTACLHCSYKSICQFDPLFEGNEIHILRQRGKDQLWSELEQNVSP
ncbi:helicase-exonuclease AddAB subunit AddB [Paenibacillus sp. CGMCC 1.16610]|uniref:ATP-dependent helicase/deoxyribonuclease subunit B n=1 Tax=Paenibacillus anseongense TaxID=2682845 RepID=A0ABW9UAQ8_9BACL|nr:MULTISPECIES: helicase-exonuclease AddAB subunit AddB [Paenibacillus]MBA2938155.1 helicase-exonuclease AddAB subunit AddB [Paenibacillus sp. CGMCC 1.16610]MVQ37212.1 helicase-exonuclease AddAB subunit AddB [Paenibacillus anseongense]